MIVDTFLLHDEWDLLACRVYELGPVVDLFVAVVGDRTFTGEPFDAGRDVSMPKLHVEHIVLPEEGDAWAREHYSREAVAAALDRLGVPGDAIILHGDVDEIPQREHVAALTSTMRFLHRLHYYAVDWECPLPTPGTIAMRRSEISSFFWMREQRHESTLPMLSSGHHFSWLGPSERRAAKLAAFSHTELRESWGACIEECAAAGRYPPPDNRPLIPGAVDATYPAWIRDGHAPAHWYR